MSHELTNFRTTGIRLDGNGKVLNVPPGWSGTVNLTDQVNVYGLTQTVTTNVTPGTNATGLCIISTQMDTPGYSVTMSPPAGPLAVGSTFEWTVYDGLMQSLASGSQTVFDDYSETWHFSVLGGNVSYFGYPQPWPGTTNYTTNATAEALLGTYNAASTVRLVEVHDAVEVFDYSGTVEAFSLGFIFALTVSIFKWVTRIIRTIPGNSEI